MTTKPDDDSSCCLTAATNVGALANAAAPTADGLNAVPMAPFSQLIGGQYGRTLPSYGFRPTVMAKPPAAG
ncbi:PPE family protein, SVP subgroup [Mycobacterium simiae]|uniref:PPE family protein, SVP subgroup n=1 Tax=Mycobacterium simiae TaxID=1784 RepID=UPI00165F8AC9|nr:hypothetical protein [Mycobacterium simiae]